MKKILGPHQLHKELNILQLHKILPPPQNPEIPPVPQAPHPPQAPQVLQQPVLHMSPLNWSHFKPEFSGKPDEDAEAHLFMTNNWMDTQISGQCQSTKILLDINRGSQTMVQIIKANKHRLVRTAKHFKTTIL